MNIITEWTLFEIPDLDYAHYRRVGGTVEVLSGKMQLKKLDHAPKTNPKDYMPIGLEIDETKQIFNNFLDVNEYHGGYDFPTVVDWQSQYVHCVDSYIDDDPIIGEPYWMRKIKVAPQFILGWTNSEFTLAEVHECPLLDAGFDNIRRGRKK